MTFIPVDNTAQVEFLFRLDSQSIENTYYVTRFAALDLAALTEIADVGLAWLASDYFPQLSNLITCVGVKVTDLTSSSSGTYTAVPGSPLAGGVAQPSEPGSVAFCIKHLTGSRGRSFRGRSYVPAIPHTSLTGTNTINASFANAMVDAFLALDADYVTALYTPVVVSRFSGGLARVAGITTPILNHAYTDLTLDSMRTRLPGRGN